MDDHSCDPGNCNTTAKMSRFNIDNYSVGSKECKDLAGDCDDQQKGGSSNVMRYVIIAVVIAIAYFLYKRFKK